MKSKLNVKYLEYNLIYKKCSKKQNDYNQIFTLLK